MLNKTYSESLNSTLAKTKDQTATQVTKEKVMQLYWVGKFTELQNRHKQALEADDFEECRKLICLEKKTQWIGQSGFERKLITSFFPDHVDLFWRCWPFISHLVPLEYWNLGRLIHLILHHKLPLQHISNWINLMKDCSDEDILFVFTKGVEYWSCKDGIIWNTINLSNDKEFDLLSTFLSQLESEKYRSQQLRNGYELYTQALNVTTRAGISHGLKRMKFMYKLLGDDLKHCDILYRTLEIEMLCPQYRLEFRQVFDYWVSEVKWDPSEKIEDTTILHKLISKNHTSLTLLQYLIAKYGRLITAALIVKDRNDLLPIQLFTQIFIARRASHRIEERYNEDQRAKMVELCTMNCPDLTVYRKHKIHDEIEKLIHCTGDNKAKYISSLNRLK